MNVEHCLIAISKFIEQKNDRTRTLYYQRGIHVPCSVTIFNGNRPLISRHQKTFPDTGICGEPAGWLASSGAVLLLDQIHQARPSLNEHTMRMYMYVRMYVKYTVPAVAADTASIQLLCSVIYCAFAIAALKKKGRTGVSTV